MNGQAAPAARVLPVTDDVDTGPYFAGLAGGRLLLRTCLECNTVQHPPLLRCRRCGSWNTEWQDVAPRGSVYSWTITEHQVHPAFPVPYTVVLVDLEDRPDTRLVGYLPGRADLRPGQKLEGWFEHLQSGDVLLQWRPLEEA
jgi:uncharacterized protein